MRALRPVHASAGRKVRRSIQRASDGGLRLTPHWRVPVRGARLDPYRGRETLARPALCVSFLAILFVASTMAAPVDNAALDVTRLDRWWNFDRPAESEARFRVELGNLPTGSAAEIELRTQIARAQGLQRSFDAANDVLDQVEKALPGRPQRVTVRYLLERGRVFNSSGQATKAVPLFREALERSLDAGEDFLAIDAAHMLGIAAPPADRLKWNLDALAMTERTSDSRSKRWLASLYNNIGWTYHERGDYATALHYFQKALPAWQARGGDKEVRIAKWTIARALRSLRRLDEAWAIQRALLAEYEAAAEPSGYVYEELAEIELAHENEMAARPWFAKAYAALSTDPWLQANESARLERLRQRGGIQ